MSSSKKDTYIKSMGLGWFISYTYYLKIDSQHLSWQNSNFSQKALATRKSNFNNSREFHKDYINQAINLNRNSFDSSNKKLSLTADEIIQMAKKLKQVVK